MQEASATQVWERLFIGGIGDAEALCESNPLGITTIIRLCGDMVPKFAPLGSVRRALR